MTDFPNLKSSEIEKILNGAKAELARRKKINIAFKEIKKILGKYNLKPEHIDWHQLNKMKIPVEAVTDFKPLGNVNKAAHKKTLKKDQRSLVAPKYLNPNNSKEAWSGRGRAPRWVNNICAKEKIDLKSFKQDSRFRV